MKKVMTVVAVVVSLLGIAMLAIQAVRYPKDFWNFIKHDNDLFLLIGGFTLIGLWIGLFSVYRFIFPTPRQRQLRSKRQHVFGTKSN